METKEKMQALFQGSWQPLHVQMGLPFASPSPNRNPFSSLTPKGGKTTMKRPNEEWESFQRPLATSKRLSNHLKLFFYRAKWGMTQNLMISNIKYPFFDMSTTPLLNLVSTPLSVKFYELNSVQPHFSQLSLVGNEPHFSPLSRVSAQSHYSTAQPCVVWQHSVFEALGIVRSRKFIKINN